MQPDNGCQSTVHRVKAQLSHLQLWLCISDTHIDDDRDAPLDREADIARLRHDPGILTGFDQQGQPALARRCIPGHVDLEAETLQALCRQAQAAPLDAHPRAAAIGLEFGRMDG